MAMDIEVTSSAPSHLALAVHHLNAYISYLARVVGTLTAEQGRDVESVVAVVEPPALRPPALPSAHAAVAPKRQGGRPRKVAVGAEAAPAAKGRKPTAAPDAAGGRSGGRRPSELTIACRTYVLQTLSRHPSSMTFNELKTAVTPALKAQGVVDDQLASVLNPQLTALKEKGFLKRTSGAWAITDAGRAEVVRMREAAKAEGALA